MIKPAAMVLTIVGEGPLGKTLLSALETLKQPVRPAEASDPDLFLHALNCPTILYAPSTDLLAGTLHPTPAPERMKAVLSASNAPGVKLLVLVRPRGAGYQAEEDLLVRQGIPYVIVESPPLIEELSQKLAEAEDHTLWVPKGARARLTSSQSLEQVVLRALQDDEVQGRTLVVEGEESDLAEVLKKAAGEKVAVHAVPRFLDRATRAVRSWFGLTDPPLRELCNAIEQTKE